MSCDFAVWHTSKRLSHQQASELYAKLCEHDTSGVEPSPAIGAFYEELTAKHPEIDNVPEEKIDDNELCPWSIALDRSSGHIIMSSVWSKAEYVEDLVRKLSMQHGLAMYDPQNGVITYPARSHADPSRSPWWRFW